MAKGVTPPPFRRMQGLGSAYSEAVEAGGRGLWVGAPEGTGGQGAVEGGHRGFFGVFLEILGLDTGRWLEQ